MIRAGIDLDGQGLLSKVCKASAGWEGRESEEIKDAAKNFSREAAFILKIRCSTSLDEPLCMILRYISVKGYMSEITAHSSILAESKLTEVLLMMSSLLFDSSVMAAMVLQ